MALNGYFYGTTANARIKPKMSWEAVQNAEENYSDVTVTLSYSRTNSGYTTAGNWSGTIYLGDQSQSGRKYITVTHNSDTEALTATFRVYHDDYGELKLFLSAEGEIYNPADSSLKSTVISGEIELDTIIRAATISATNGAIEAVSTIVVAQKNSAYVHSIQYMFGELSGYINATGNTVEFEETFANTAINFRIPLAFYTQIPDSSSGICTLVCRTYSNGAQIGVDQYAEFVVTADYYLCHPIVKGSVTDINEETAALTGDPGTLVQFVSKARCTISAQAQNGSAIKVLRIGGVEVDDEACMLEITSPSFRKIIFEAVDSRGYTSTYELPVTLIPYTALTNNARIQRTDPTSGNALLTLQGNCWLGNFGAADNSLIASIQVNSEDPVDLQLEIGEDSKYFAEVTLSGLDYTKSHTVNVFVADLASSVRVSLPVQKGIPVFDWGEGDFKFNVPVEMPNLTINGVSLADYIRTIIEGG